jgi:hypothetical protein
MQTSGCPARFMFGGCRCKLDSTVWQNESLQASIYPKSKLMTCQGLLLRFDCSTHEVFGLHSLRAATRWHVRALKPRNRLFFSMSLVFPNATATSPLVFANAIVTSSIFVRGVGISCVRTLQRWWRTMLWRPKALAVMMGQHNRLGQESQLMVLDKNLLEMCLALC